MLVPVRASPVPTVVRRFKFFFLLREKERKKTGNPREGWEDGTLPPHRDFKERGVIVCEIFFFARVTCVIILFLLKLFCGEFCCKILFLARHRGF